MPVKEHKNGSEMAGAAVMMADSKKQEAIRQTSRGASLPARQQYMLSYLNRAQLKMWNSYSPIQQRKIMEEIEKKLERKLPDPDITDVPMKREASFDIEAYQEEERSPGEYRIRGHPEEISLRTVHEADIRSRRTVLRVNPARPVMQHTLSGSRIGTSRAERCKGSNVERSQMQAEKARSDNGGRNMCKPPSRETQTGATQAEAAQAAGIRKQQRLKALKKDQQRNGGMLKGSEIDLIQQRQIRVQGKSEGDSYSGNRKSVADHIDDHSSLLTGSYTAKKQTARDHLTQRGRKEKNQQETESIRTVDDEIRTITDSPVLDKRGNLNTETDGAASGLPLQTRYKEAEGQKRADAGMMSVLASEEIFKDTSIETETPGMVPTATSKGDLQAPVNVLQERRSVVKEAEKAEKQLYIADSMGAAAQRTRNGNRNDRQRIHSRNRERRREAKYRKEFASLLVATIEKDMAKQQNIRQAQKSGQISATVAELTGETGRGAVRTAAIPIRVSLQILTKKLREEIKKRMQEAARNLARHAATFAAPILAVVIIVMLLASICMIGTTEDQPQGTGLGFRIVQEAKKHLGLPYVYGGTSLVDGCDCSGFVWAIYNLFGYNLPRTAGDQYSYGRKVGSDINDWQMGDLIYYSRTGTVQSGGGRAEHIVIYIGGGQVISCGPVTIHNWDYRSDYYGTCRIIPDEPLGGDFSGSTNEEICWNYFISKGFSEAATAGILGNMYVETGGTFDPSIHQYGGGPGRGLCQWEESYSGGSGRYNNLVAFASGLGKSWDDITAQLQFVCYELDTGQMNPYFAKFGGVEAFKNMTDPSTAAYVFLCGFEYCGDPGRSFLEAKFALSTRVDHAGWAYLNYYCR